jgi:outer membrane protein TolC
MNASPLLVIALLAAPAGASTKTLTLDEFVQRAAASDSRFEEILIDRLALRYREDARLPSRDLVLSVREELGIKLDTDHGTDDLSVSLSKLFPKTGTEVSASYDLNPIGAAGRATSSAGFTVAQPIAENAFGRSTRLLAKLVGVEVEVARHQIVEAYEDYFASVVRFYLDWYEAYENLLIARSSYKENQKLLTNMRERRKARVADKIDVDKITLQVLGRKERLVQFEERHASRLNLVRRVLRDESGTEWTPVRPEESFSAPADPDASIERFRDSGRTFRILRLLERQAGLTRARELDDLLPSLELFAGYERTGKSLGVEESDNRALAGLSLSLPIGNQTDRAEAETAKIAERKARLSTGNADWRLRTDLDNLGLFMRRERELLDIATEKIGLAQAVLVEETENYTYGKVSLNDYIESVNRLDSARFEEIDRFVEWRRLNLEWLRLTDTLVEKSPPAPSP